MGQHAAQLGLGELRRGIGGDDHQVPAARKGVELLGRQDAQHVSVDGQAVRRRDVGPRSSDATGLMRVGEASSEDRSEDCGLEGPDEEDDTGHEERDGDPPVRDVGQDAEREPQHGEREQRERCHRSDGDERPDR